MRVSFLVIIALFAAACTGDAFVERPPLDMGITDQGANQNSKTDMEKGPDTGRESDATSEHDLAACTNNDGFCPLDCTPKNDDDCFAFRANGGIEAGQMTTFGGHDFQALVDYVKSGTASNSRYALEHQIEINKTDFDAFYQTETWTPSDVTTEFEFAVKNGKYTVHLHFVDWAQATHIAGDRVFGVALEGESILNQFDIISEVGKNTALVKSFDVEVKDGALNLEILPLTAEPEIAGIEIVSPNHPYLGKGTVIVEPPIEPEDNEVHIRGSHTVYTKIQDAINAANSGDIIEVSNGVYHEALTIPKDLTIKAVDGAKNVVLSGAKPVENWTFDNGRGLYSAQSPCGNTDFVFVDGRKQSVAFFPARGYIGGQTSDVKTFTLDNESYNRTGIFTKTTAAITIPQDLAGALAITHYKNWERSASYVGSVSGNTVTLKKKSRFLPEFFNGLRFAYVVSAIEKNGEWGMNNGNIFMKLSKKPTKVTAACLENAISIDDSAHKVTIDGLRISAFKGHGVVFTSGAGPKPDSTQRHLKPGETFKVINSTISYLGGIGIVFRSLDEQPDAHIEIANNEFRHVLSTEIALFRIYGAKIHHNSVHEIGGEEYGQELVSRNDWGVGTGFQLDDGSNMHIHHNDLKNLGYIGINITNYSERPVGGRIIEYNTVTNAIQSLNDGGCIYSYGGGAGDGSKGMNIIKNNIVQNCVGNVSYRLDDTHYEGAGIYTDNRSNHFDIANNTIFGAGTGLYYHENHDVHAHHNNILNGQWATVEMNDHTTNKGNIFDHNTIVNANTDNGWETFRYDGVALESSDYNVIRTYDGKVFQGMTHSQWTQRYGFDQHSTVLVNKSQMPIVLTNPKDSSLTFKKLDGCKNADDSASPSSITLNAYEGKVLFECANYAPGMSTTSK